ncbi:MAG TPA: TIGR01906 family membrane protein [Anaerolineae bacterium]
MESRILVNVVRWLVILAMPVFLGFGTIRALIAWDYPAFEYARIPPDRFGLTPEERLALAHATLEYLRRPEPATEMIDLLADLRLPDTDESLYNERELEHMVDVKRLTDAIGSLFVVAAVIVVGGLIFLLVQPALRPLGYRAILHGGLATVALLAAIALFILLGWSLFFVQFHELLFPPGTWTFSYSDSLIRLFPEQFWFDFGVLVSVATLVEGVLVAAAGYLLARGQPPVAS